jgi:CheY-like chemotaxis protein
MDAVQGRTGRILVAEDVEAVACSIAAALEARGFRTARAQDGAECLALARSFQPDLILLDVMMPRVHGMEALKQLKAQDDTRRIGVIVCTAKGFKPELDWARELGAFDVIVKPVADTELVAHVERFFARAGAAAPRTLLPAQLPPRVGGEIFRPRLDTTGVCCRLCARAGGAHVA